MEYISHDSSALSAHAMHNVTTMFVFFTFLLCSGDSDPFPLLFLPPTLNGPWRSSTPQARSPASSTAPPTEHPAVLAARTPHAEPPAVLTDQLALLRQDVAVVAARAPRCRRRSLPSLSSPLLPPAVVAARPPRCCRRSHPTLLSPLAPHVVVAAR